MKIINNVWIILYGYKSHTREGQADINNTQKVTQPAASGHTFSWHLV